MSSRHPRKGSEAGQGWTYATDGNGRVLWYCPIGGGEEDRCANKPMLMAYWKRQHRNDRVPPHFNFKEKDVPRYYKSVCVVEEDVGTGSGDDDDDVDEAHESQGTESDDDAGSRKPKRVQGSSSLGISSPSPSSSSRAPCSPEKVQQYSYS